jgi:hypothetical protein
MLGRVERVRRVRDLDGARPEIRLLLSERGAAQSEAHTQTQARLT